MVTLASNAMEAIPVGNVDNMVRFCNALLIFSSPVPAFVEIVQSSVEI